MQIDGEWSLCDDGVVRPLMYGEILAGNGLWVPAEFLMDTGADRLVYQYGLAHGLICCKPHEPMRLSKDKHQGGRKANCNGAEASQPCGRLV